MRPMDGWCTEQVLPFNEGLFPPITAQRHIGSAGFVMNPISWVAETREIENGQGRWFCTLSPLVHHLPSILVVCLKLIKSLCSPIMTHGETNLWGSSPVIVPTLRNTQTHTQLSDFNDQLSEAERPNHHNNYQSGFQAYVTKVDRCIESYRDGKLSKFDVISTITQLLGEDDDLSGEEKSQSLKLYLAEINSIQASPRWAEKWKAKEAPPIARQRLSSILAEDNWLARSRGFDGDESPSSSGSDEDKRQHHEKLQASDMPWSKREDGKHDQQNPSCAKTANIIRKLNCNLKSAKLHIKLAPGAPWGIPMSEWEHIFKGEAEDPWQYQKRPHTNLRFLSRQPTEKLSGFHMA